MSCSSAVILALECSADQVTAAVSRHGKVIGHASHAASHRQATWIIPLAIEAVKQSGCAFDELTHIVAGRGPGSFTGIRVALAAAKGFALAMNIGATGLSSLAGMAAQMQADKKAKGRHLLASIDSRRHSMFFQAFSPEGCPLTDIRDGDCDSVKALIAEKNVAWAIAGPAAANSNDSVNSWLNNLHGDIITIDTNAPQAKGLLSLFNEHYEDETGMRDLEPLYLSAPLLGSRS